MSFAPVSVWRWRYQFYRGWRWTSIGSGGFQSLCASHQSPIDMHLWRKTSCWFDKTSNTLGMDKMLILSIILSADTAILLPYDDGVKYTVVLPTRYYAKAYDCENQTKSFRFFDYGLLPLLSTISQNLGDRYLGSIGLGGFKSMWAQTTGRTTDSRFTFYRVSSWLCMFCCCGVFGLWYETNLKRVSWICLCRSRRFIEQILPSVSRARSRCLWNG